MSRPAVRLGPIRSGVWATVLCNSSQDSLNERINVNVFGRIPEKNLALAPFSAVLRRVKLPGLATGASQESRA
jgi:hypothetical protein